MPTASGFFSLKASASACSLRTTGNQKFSFQTSGTFTGAAGELIYRNGVVSADTDGDRAADFQILIANGAPLTAGDFVL